MKKLAIMFVMLLGSVATMQAQSNTTFDFSCLTAAEQQAADDAADEATNVELPFDVDQAPLFTETQPEILVGAGFTVGRQVHGMGDDQQIFTDVNHYAIQINSRSFVSIDVESDGYAVFSTHPDLGIFNMNYNTFAEAMESAIAQIRRINNGVVPAEETMLSDASFTLQSGTSVFARDYTISHGDTTHVNIIFEEGRFKLDGSDLRYSYLEANVTYYNTLAEALAALALVDFSSL